MAESAFESTHDQKKTHKKKNSIHRRRGYEMNGNGSMTDDFDFDASVRKESDVLGMATEEETGGVRIHVGDLVQLRDNDSVGLVHCLNFDEENPGMIGVELEGPVGESNGVYKGEQLFRSPKNCAMFVDMSQIIRILETGPAPRFYSQVHDIYRGDVVIVSSSIGVGIARYVSANLIGIELNIGNGTSDGSHQGRRFFQVQPNYAVFAPPETLKKIHPEDLLNKLNNTVERLNEIEESLRSTTHQRR